MTNSLPTNPQLPIGKLAAIFNNTTNSYKYVWFLAILDCLKNPINRDVIAMDSLAVKMIVKVWYPINSYRLSFGKQDRFVAHIKDLIAQNPILMGMKTLELEKWLLANLTNSTVNKIVKELLQYVPFRFLSMFFVERLVGLEDAKKNDLIVAYANTDFLNESNCPIYKFALDKKQIILHPLWKDYLHQHLQILTDFCKWNLLLYLQKNNPNVPNIAEKLEPETARDLKNGKTFWKNALIQDIDFECIYSQEILTEKKISIDHFLPWSFVGHDLLWNLVPTTRSVNSKKSDCLPDLKVYLDSFLNIQFQSFHLNLQLGKDKLLEDYSLLFSKELSEIQQFSQNDFHDRLRDNIQPLHQIAQNMGFTPNWTYKS